MSDINDIASKCDLFIDNAATASQTDFDDVTREAIRLNVFAPMLSALIAATPRPEASDAPDIVPVAWLEMRNEPADDWTKRVVATNPEYVANNGPENFVGLVPADALATLRAENMKLQAENRGLFLAHRIQHDLREAAEAELAAVTRERDEARANHEYFATQWDDRGYTLKAAEAEVARLKDENKALVAGLEPFAQRRSLFAKETSP